ncbi:MAG: DUF5675 family protein [Nitrospiraceae bacterium]
MLTLNRFANTPNGTPGRMGDLYTMERPDLGNVPMLSRIPGGEYDCVRTWYHRGGYDTYEIINVPGRTRILFHRGNWMTDVNGCVATGMEFGLLDGRLAVLHSADAFNIFMRERNGILSFPFCIVDED